MLVTTHMLRQMLAEVNEDVSHSLPVQGRTGITTSNGNDVFLSTETITKVDGDTMITREGTKAKLYSPMPCLYWKCVSTPDKDGVITLRQPITGVFLNDGENAICLGVSGASDEFEVRFHVGENEVRINNEWLNLASKHIIKNGVEIE